MDFDDIFVEFETTNIQVRKQSGGGWNMETGKYDPPTEETVDVEAIVVPLTEDDLQYDDGGTYTSQDKKVYYQGTLGNGQAVVHKGDQYEIQAYKDYSHYTDFNVYIMRRVTRGGTE